jgi:hypothetical protein
MYCVLEGKRSLREDRYWGMYNVLIHNTLYIPQYLSPLKLLLPSIITLYIPQYLSLLKLLLPSNTQYIVHSSISTDIEECTMYCVLKGKRSLRGDRYWGMYNVLCIEGQEKFKERQILRPFNTQYIVHSPISVST